MDKANILGVYKDDPTTRRKHARILTHKHTHTNTLLTHTQSKNVDAKLWRHVG